MGKIGNYPLRKRLPETKFLGTDPLNSGTYNYLISEFSSIGFITLIGLGNPDTDFTIFQDALNEGAQDGRAVYIPPNEHLRLTDFPIFPDNSVLINDGIYENVSAQESYAFQGCLFGLGRIATSDFWPNPNTIGTILSTSGNRILFSSVTNASWFTSYASKTGLKETRAFYNGGEGNPAASIAYLSAIGNDGSNYYIDLEDSEGNPIDALVSLPVENIFPVGNGNNDIVLLITGVGALYEVGDTVYYTEGSNPPLAQGEFTIKAKTSNTITIDLQWTGAEQNGRIGRMTSIDLTDTILASSGFLNQQGVNVFKLQPAYRGNRVVMLNSGDIANFTVGEKVLLKGAGSYVVRYPNDRSFTPYYSHADIIEAIDGDVITLAIGVHDLGEELTDLELCKFVNLRTLSPNHPSGGISPNCVRNVFIGGNGKFIQNTNRSIIAYAGGCMIDCTFDINEVEGGGFTTNAFCRSTAKINKLTSPNTIVAVALGSCDFDINIKIPRLVKAAGEGSAKTSRTVIFPHENIVNGKILLGTITTSYDYPLAINVLEMDCMGVEVDYAFEIDKREQVETPSFGNGIQVRSQDPQLLGDARGHHGRNRIKQRAGSSPYVAQVLGIDDAINDYPEQPSEYDIQYSGAFGEGVVIGAFRNQHSVKFNFDRARRLLRVSDFTKGENTIVTFSSGDTRAFADGQRVKFEGIVPASWDALNSNNYLITRIVSDTQIEIDFDSSGFSNYSGSGNPTMEGAEAFIFVRDNLTSYTNSIEGYCNNAVDVTISGIVWSLSGANYFNLEDAKSRRFKGLAFIRSLANSGNIATLGNFAARPATGYQMTTAGIELSGVGNPRYPSLFRAGYFDFVQFASTNCLLSTLNTNLKVGDTFVKTIRGRIYGSYAGQKTIIDTYRWNEGSTPANRGFQTFSFDTNITGGDGFEMRTYLRFPTSNYIVAWAVFNDGTEQRVSETRFVVTTLIGDFRNHLIAYFDSSFAPVSPYNSEADIIAYEETFAGESVTGNTRERIQIESVEFSYERK
jgi:hypothetical protein